MADHIIAKVYDQTTNALRTTGGGGGGGATAANQTTTNTALGAPADAEATGNGSIIAILKRVRTLLGGGLPAALGASGGLKVESGGYTTLTAVDFVRPADVVAYGVNDAIADSTTAPTILTFTNAARTAGGSGYVVRARVMTDQSANVAVYRLHLFRSTVAAINDNAPFTTLIANRANYLGYIEFPAASTEGTGSDAAVTQNLDTRLAFVASGTSLFGILQTKLGFTPVSGQRFYVELGIEQN